MARNVVRSGKSSTRSPGASDRAAAASEGTSGEALARLASRSVPLARIVAGNASADGALLEELSHHEDAGVRRKVAGNPATPAAAAIALGGRFPAELLGNPSFDLYLLEASELLESLGISALRAMLKRDGCPASLMAWASRQESEATQLAVLANAAAPVGVVEALAGSAHERVRAAARGHVALASRAPAEGWEEAFRRGIREEWEKTSKVHEAHRALARLIMAELEWKRLPEGADALAVATALRPRDVPNCGGIIASGLFTDAEELAALARDPVTGIRAGVAGYPGTPQALLERLAKDSNGDVRQAVAGNAATPVAALAQLARDEDGGVRATVAGNAATPPALLEQLAKDGNSDVRRIVARNATTLVALLEQLAEDDDWDVRDAVAKNASTPAAVLGEFARDEGWGLRPGVAANPATPAAILEEFAKHEDWDVRKAVAANAASPVSVLEQLARDEDSDVRKALAKNPSTPAASLEQLAKDEWWGVRQAVAENPATPAAVLAQLAGDEHGSVRMSVAGNVSAPIDLLVPFAEDKSIQVLRAIARNAAMPATLLEKLAGHAHGDVRQSAAENAATPRRARLAVFAAARLLETFAAVGQLTDEFREPEVLSFLRSRLPASELLASRISKARKVPDLAGLRKEFVGAMAAAGKPSLHRTMALVQPDCPEKTLARCQRSSWWIERVAIARNPNCPKVVFGALSIDSNLIVRAAAARRTRGGVAASRWAVDAVTPAPDRHHHAWDALLSRSAVANIAYPKREKKVPASLGCSRLAEVVFHEVWLSRRDSAGIVMDVLNEIGFALERGEVVKIAPLGRFFVRKKGRRVGRSPRTGETILIPPRNVLVFRPSLALKRKVGSAGLRSRTPKED